MRELLTVAAIKAALSKGRLCVTAYHSFALAFALPTECTSEMQTASSEYTLRAISHIDMKFIFKK